MVKAMVTYLSESSGEQKNVVNIVPGWVEPSDMREIKRITASMGIETIMFPDTSAVLDAPQAGKYIMYPKGGTTIEQMKATGDSMHTIALGKWGSQAAAEALDAKCKVPCSILDLPIGLSATDRFVDKLRKLSKGTVSENLVDERGRLVDMITDMQQYLYGKRVAIYGDQDQLVSMTEFLADLGMKPVYIVTGAMTKKFDKKINEILNGRVPEVKIKNGGDMFLMHQWIKNEPVDLMIGNTYGKYIARDEDIPFLRFGFPILDRMGHSYFPSVGYAGAMRVLENILNLLLDRQDRDAPEESFELVM
jgi:nitrogenase molybdenum-iron protein beta chain